VKASGVGVLDDLLEKEILYLKNARTAVLYWDVDAPATLERLRTNPDDPFRNLLPRYDLILTYGGGQPVIRGYLSLGARQCIPIYNALDPETHFPVPKDPAFAADLAFLGNRLPDRESRMEEFFLQTALKLPNRSFLLAGNGWDDKPMSGNIRYIGHLGTADHNAFNSTPLAVLNINRSSMARYGFSPATRIFEAAGSGACILTDKWEGIEQFLEPGEEILVAETGEHVASLLEGLSREEAARIGRNAMRRIISEHTYEHRARQFHAIFASGPAAVKPEESAASPVFP
jgi:spore maturation protein CgeB